MGNQLSSAFSCGMLEALAGDPDWTISSNGAIRRSAAYRARAQSATEQRVRARLQKREDKCFAIEKKIADLNDEALSCKRLLQTPGVSLTSKQKAMARAQIALRNIGKLQMVLKAKRSTLQQGESILSRIDLLQEGDDDVELFKDLTSLARGLDMTDAKVDAIQAAGEEVLEEHSKLGDAEDALIGVSEQFAQSETANGGIDGEFDLNDESDLLAALQQLEDRQQASEWQPTQPPRHSTASVFRTAPANDGMVPVELSGAPSTPQQSPVGVRMYQPSQNTASAVTTSGHVEQRAANKRSVRFANVADEMTSIL